MRTAEKLREIIESKGIKLTAIAGGTGISIKALSQMFMLKRKMTADEFILICQFVGVSMDEVRDYKPAA